MAALYIFMNDENKYWSDFTGSGEALVHVNLYQRIHLYLLTKYSLYLQRKRVPKKSLLGSVKWTLFEALKFISQYTSPKANDVFWFWIEARWVLAKFHKNKIGFNLYEYRFVRKKHITEKDIKMNFRTYKAINEIRKHI